MIKKLDNQIKSIAEKNNGRLGGILTTLEEIQDVYGYLSEDSLKAVSRETGRSMVDLYGIATFYKAFSLTPRGKHLVSVCLGTACHVRGAPAIANEFEECLGIKIGETTPDKEITLDTVNCVGACALGPVVTVDGHYFSNVKKKGVKKIVEKIRNGLDKIDAETDKRTFPIVVSCPRCNHTLMDRDHPIDNLPSISVTVSSGRKHGWLRLTSLYGHDSVEAAFPLQVNETVSFFCPHCHAKLSSSTPCSMCDAPIVPMIIRGGGKLRICSRNGCNNHLLDLNGENL